MVRGRVDPPYRHPTPAPNGRWDRSKEAPVAAQRTISGWLLTPDTILTTDGRYHLLHWDEIEHGDDSVRSFNWEDADTVPESAVTWDWGTTGLGGTINQAQRNDNVLRQLCQLLGISL